MNNIIAKCNDALWNKTFSNGLNKYTQSNCQVTLTDDGYRIYRPPNKNPTNDGNTMWGGLIINPFSADSNAMVKSHRYVIKFEVKGQSSNAASSTYWSNNAGWGGGGLSPTPTDVVQSNPVTANFQSSVWVPFQYSFTINDDIYKVCTSSYSSFVAGETYLSYRDFKFGYDYWDTGSLGTDIYLRDFKLYDITSSTNLVTVLKPGVWKAGCFIENTGNISIKRDGDLYSNNLYEM